MSKRIVLTNRMSPIKNIGWIHPIKQGEYYRKHGMPFQIEDVFGDLWVAFSDKQKEKSTIFYANNIRVFRKPVYFYDKRIYRHKHTVLFVKYIDPL